ncbi:hypothetical protein KBC75_03890 [Candidatus Shapirobacteria bacterium]|nr:hypothetical protein [Candidatus Shapirobacteria bacterium]
MSWQKKLTKYLWVFLVLPVSTNYQLQSFSLGNGGGNSTSSTNYSMVGQIGEMVNKLSGSNFDLGAGLSFARQSNVPMVASFTNPANYYNKLKLVVDQQDNPTDTRYAIAISKDNFATTNYVKSDFTVGSTLASADYLLYSQLGGASGFEIVGLDVGTSYSVKIKAMQGSFTETDWGPESASSTVSPTLAYDIDVATTDIQTDPPYVISLGDLNPGSVVMGSSRVWVSLDTNANSGGSVMVYGQNGGLQSTTAGYLISGVSGNLSVLATGFGVQGAGVGQTSGGPLTIDVGYTGYTGSDGYVGMADTNIRQIFVSSAPITSGRASFVVKAKTDTNVPSAGDYSESLTVIAVANF